MRKIIAMLGMLLLVVGIADAQTFPVQNLSVLGTSNFVGIATFQTPVAITSGGTGAATQPGALSNILGGVPLPIANGGTNSSTATGATSNLQYSQGASGSVARSNTSKFQDTISVKDFGAKGDGSTNDTTAIQNAITAAQITHARLYIPAATYIVTALTVTASIEIVGDGMGNSILKINASQNTPILHVTSAGSQYFFIHDLSLVSSVTTASGCAGLQIDGGQAFNIDRVEVSGTYTGINIPAGQGGAVLADCWVHNITGTGYTIDAGNMLVRGNFAINCGGYGFYFSSVSGGSAGLIVTDNTSYSTNNANFAFQGNATHNIIDLVVANNVASTAPNGPGFLFDTYGEYINASNNFTELAGSNSSNTVISYQSGFLLTVNNADITINNAVAIGASANGLEADCNDFAVVGGVFVSNNFSGGGSFSGILVGAAGVVTGWTITGVQTRPGGGAANTQIFGVSSFSSGNTGLVTSSILHGTSSGSNNTGGTATFANNLTY